jgi:aryl-alcohol dehydrogenase-like predicted oxidoreductase
VYSNGRSEEIIAKAIKQFNIPRHRLVILSKCFFGVADDGTQGPGGSSAAMSTNDGPLVNRVGLSRKHIFDAVEASVKRLGTYIDVLQIHRLDRATPRVEIMKALNDVVEKGWVRYIGASSMAAWEFQALQNVAENRGWHKFVSMQGYHNLLYREEEREMIPYCQDAGIGLIPWSPVARGALTRPWNDRDSLRENTDAWMKGLIRAREVESDKAITNRVDEIAKKKGVSMAQVAIAWSIAKGMIPIVGMNKKERIDEAVETVKIKLTEDEVKYLEEPYTSKAITGY